MKEAIRLFLLYYLIILVIVGGVFAIYLIHTGDSSKSITRKVGLVENNEAVEETESINTETQETEITVIEIEEDEDDDEDEDEDDEDGDEDDEEESTSIDCSNGADLDSQCIIFYYTNEEHSNAMVPIVEDLGNNYDFYSTNNLWNDEFNDEYGLSGNTPAFVCAGTKEIVTGEMSKSELGDFARRC